MQTKANFGMSGTGGTIGKENASIPVRRPTSVLEPVKMGAATIKRADVSQQQYRQFRKVKPEPHWGSGFVLVSRKRRNCKTTQHNSPEQSIMQ